MKIEIGADEAKNSLYKLLQQVKAGKRFTITYRGRAIADLVPSHATPPEHKIAAVAKFRTFMRRNPIPKTVAAKDLADEGRA